MNRTPIAKMLVLTRHSEDLIGRICLILRQRFILSGSECRDVFVITSADDVLSFITLVRILIAKARNRASLT